MGIVSSIGEDVQQFDQSLRRGTSGLIRIENEVLSVMGKIEGFDLNQSGIYQEIPDELANKAMRIIRRMPFTMQTTVTAVLQAWNEAGLTKDVYESEKTAVITAGSNLSQGYMFDTINKYREKPEYVSPLYAIQHFDTNYNGVISEILDLHGEGMSIGGASASGNIALIQGWRMIRYGICDICICAVPMYDVSNVELRAFFNLGAFGDYSKFDTPEEACRPFDKKHQGFIPGQASACILLESEEHALKRGKTGLARFAGGAMMLDGNRLSDCKISGELSVMQKAIRECNLSVKDIDYINTHGTSTPKGDETEAAAIAGFLGAEKDRVWINSTKSMTGHCMYSAGIVEAIASICQMRGNYVHESLHLCDAIHKELRFARKRKERERLNCIMSNSFGFGGINSSIILTNV